MQKNSTLKEYDHINMADIVQTNFLMVSKEVQDSNIVPTL